MLNDSEGEIGMVLVDAVRLLKNSFAQKHIRFDLEVAVSCLSYRFPCMTRAQLTEAVLLIIEEQRTAAAA